MERCPRVYLGASTIKGGKFLPSASPNGQQTIIGESPTGQTGVGCPSGVLIGSAASGFVSFVLMCFTLYFDLARVRLDNRVLML